jgi:hypothetical protein
MKASWIGHILRNNHLFKHVIEEREWMGRPGRRCKELLDNLKEKRRYWKLKRGSTRWHCLETLLWKSYGPVARQTGQ